MVIAICVLLAAAVIGYTLLVRQRDIPPPPAEDPELKHLEARRRVLYENLKDLQFEYHQGKLSEEDYQSLKQGFLYDLAAVMDSIERRTLATGKAARPSGKAARGPDGAGKARPSGERTSTSASSSISCPSCQAANPRGNRFCGSCGGALQTA